MFIFYYPGPEILLSSTMSYILGIPYTLGFIPLYYLLFSIPTQHLHITSLPIKPYNKEDPHYEAFQNLTNNILTNYHSYVANTGIISAVKYYIEFGLLPIIESFKLTNKHSFNYTKEVFERVSEEIYADQTQEVSQILDHNNNLMKYTQYYGLTYGGVKVLNGLWQNIVDKYGQHLIKDMLNDFSLAVYDGMNMSKNTTLINFPGSIKTLRNIGQTLIVYKYLQEKSKPLPHLLIMDSQKDILGFVLQGLNLILPTIKIINVGFEKQGSLFQTNNETTMFKLLDHSSWRDFKIFGWKFVCVRFFRDMLHNMFLLFNDHVLCACVINCTDYKRTGEINPHSIHTIVNTNKLLNLLCQNTTKSFIIGHNDYHQATDPAIESRFSMKIISKPMSFQTFLMYFRGLYLEKIFQNLNDPLFPEASLDEQIYTLAIKLYHKLQLVEMFLHNIMNIRKKYPQTTLALISSLL